MLDKLPSELLAIVLMSDCSYMVVNLWKCGSKVLNYKLSNGGCIKVALKDDNPHSTSRWPKLLTSLLHLQSLSIICPNKTIMPLPALSCELRKLSPTLQSLELTLKDAQDCFLNYVSPTATYPSGGSFGQARSLFWDIGAAFPHLHTLYIGSFYSSSLGFNLAALPRTLRSLTLPYLSEDLKKPEFIALLPPNLTELGSHCAHTFHPVNLDLLPRSVTAITGCSPIIRPEDEKPLPPNLTRLRAHFLSTVALTQQAFLPNELSVALDLPLHKAPSWNCVTNLTLSTSVIDPTTILLLPRTLTILTFNGDVQWDFAAWPVSESPTSAPLPSPWPSTLHTFIHKPLQLEPYYLFVLPRSLTTLHTHPQHGSSGQLDFAHLSPTMLDLRMHLPAHPPHWMVESELPPHLTTLHISAPAVGFKFPRIPQSVTELSLRHQNSVDLYSKDAIYKAPLLYLTQNLVHLEGVHLLCAEVQQLPSRITHLGIASFNGSLATQQHISEPFQIHAAFRHLNKLRTLYLPSSAVFTANVIAALPRGLTRLQMALSDWNDAAIASLPRKLRNFSPNFKPNTEYETTIEGYQLFWPKSCALLRDIYSKVPNISRFHQEIESYSSKYPDPRVLNQ